MTQKTTIRDVAKYAGVSVATVSYVINGVNKVSDETKQRVLQAIQDLQYQPNFTAVSLSTKKSNMFGILIPLVEDTLAPVFAGNQYYSELISGIEYVSRKSGYDFLISGASNPNECRNWVTKRNLDGLLFLGSFPEKLYEEMKTLHTKIVLVDAYEEYSRLYHNIRMDDELGGYLAARHLAERGHSRIAFVAPGINNPIDRRRFLGFENALKEHHISVNPEWIFLSGDGAFQSGYNVGMRLMQSEATAAFATSDILALGMIKAIHEHNKEVPHDYSIVGFDDLIISQYSSPSLTTVRQDVFNKGAIAAQTLIDTVESKQPQAQTVTLPVELAVRDSTRFL
ncbi:LacI family transcriptional regulator [Ectobacillus funiculus]|uniref:LacI family DNA-binding transcriptional regulator n=1 Tax=Ectobacillus funiculus TaxID=137993 RepID=UPI00397903BB